MTESTSTTTSITRTSALPVRVADFVSQATEVNGHRIAILDGRHGLDATPVVLIHGVTLSARYWPHALSASFLDSIPWMSVSLPGHFPSTVPDGFSPGDVSPQMFADIVGGVIREALGGKPAHVIGWSTGGFAALCTAALQPDIVRSVVSIAGFARGQWAGGLGWLQRLAGGGDAGAWSFRTLLGMSRRRRFIFNSVMAGLAHGRQAYRSHAALDDTMSAMHEDYRRHDVDVMRTLFDGIRSIDASEAFRQIACPAMIIGGAKDPASSTNETRYIASLVPDSELKILDGVGHMYFEERPAEMQRLLSDWVLRWP